MQIKSLTLPVNAPLRQTAFYEDVLGLRALSNAEGTIIQAGLTKLSFTEGQDRHHFAFNITPAKIEAAREWLLARGAKLIDGKVHHFADWNAHAVYFWDPAGNVVEFIARHDLPAPKDQPDFTPADILSVSEIGLHAPDPAALAAQVMAQTGATYYRPPSSDFHPVGDAEGLFIIVPAGRLWFPDTGVPAAGHPSALRVETHGKVVGLLG